jgi:hypothetical protein
LGRLGKHDDSCTAKNKKHIRCGHEVKTDSGIVNGRKVIEENATNNNKETITNTIKH